MMSPRRGIGFGQPISATSRARGRGHTGEARRVEADAGLLALLNAFARPHIEDAGEERASWVELS
jgi:hypothetical protein